MKVISLFVHFDESQYALLQEKYPGEVGVKIFLHQKISEEIFIEVEQIKNDKALAVLGATEKL